MQSDFQDAHHRHWRDAELLFNEQRWANADHLYGMAAECGLKRLMMAFGMPFETHMDRPQKPKDRQHIDKIWARYETYRSNPQGAEYGLTPDNPFQDWQASQRYAPQDAFDEQRAFEHRNGAEQVRRLIRKAQREGLI